MKVALLLCVLQPRQQSRRPEGSHSKSWEQSVGGGVLMDPARRPQCPSKMSEECSY